MFKKLIFAIFIFIASFQVFAQQEDQAEIKQQEETLLSSLKNFNKKELMMVKEYVEILKKLIQVCVDQHSLGLQDGDFIPPHLYIKFQKLAYKIMMFRMNDFIQKIHVKICQLSLENCNIDDQKVDISHEILPFLDEDSMCYVANLAKKILCDIEKIKNH